LSSNGTDLFIPIKLTPALIGWVRDIRACSWESAFEDIGVAAFGVNKFSADMV